MRNRDTLFQPIQMELSQKQKNIYDLFSAFLKSILNFEYFQKKDDSHSRYFPEITGSEKRG